MGIAVNPELQYAVVRVADGLFIVAKQRLEALKSVVGESVVLFELKGTYCSRKNLRLISNANDRL